MTPEQFAYWLQGFAELNPNPPTPEQWQSIREHVATVFKKVTPPVAQPPSILAPKPADLNEAIKRELEKREREKPPTVWPIYPLTPKERWTIPQTDPLGRPTLIC